MRDRGIRGWHGFVGLVALLGLAACSGTGGNPSPSNGSASSTKAVPPVDACTVLSAQELSGIGLNSPGTPSAATTEVGCNFKGQRYTATLAVDRARTLDGYIAGSQNQTVRQITANGRRAVLIQNSPDDFGCSELLELGGGVFAVTMNYKVGQKGDACAEVEHIGRVVEPKLPK